MELKLTQQNSFLSKFMSIMKYLKFIILISFIFELNGQVIKDSLSDSRDVTFFNFDNNGKTISLGRILKKTEGGKTFSVREGEEMLVSFIDGEISYHFEDIDGYSSLFLEDAIFKIQDLDNDGLNEIIIEIEPFESSNHIWIYTIQKNNVFKFIYVKELRSYEIISGNVLKIKTNPFCQEWGDCLYDMAFDKEIDFSKLLKVDFFRFEKNKFVNINHLYKCELDKLKSDYEFVLKQIENSNLIMDIPYEQERLKTLKGLIKQMIME